jgi:2-oxoglutarate ferredoxin oxidoreductase subunit beta
MEFGDRIPLGVLYYEQKPTYHEKNVVLKQGVPLLDRKTDAKYVNRLIQSYV